MRTVVSRLQDHAAERPDATAVAIRDSSGWRTKSWRQLAEEVRAVSRALIALGVKSGGTVGILGFNRPEWMISCVGSMAAGAVPAGIYQTCSSDQVAYILRHAESRVVVVENREQLEKVEAARGQLRDLRHIVVMSSSDLGEVGAHVLSWEEFLARAEEVPEAEAEAREAAIAAEQIATLIYTSGTTGTPKAVMLSHSNIVETGRIGAELHGLQPGDRVVSYLPLAHIAEQMISIHISLYVGYAVYYVEAPERLADNLRDVQPTLFFGVPRVWERIYGAVREGLRGASPLRRSLLAWATGVGREVSELIDRGETPGPWLGLRHRLADRVVLSKVRQRLGLSQTKVASSGAAPIQREVLDFFAGLGIRIFEVYGLSECCGPATWSSAGRSKLGTVGPPLPEVEVRIGDDGEVLVRGPNVFMGYLKDEASTSETLVDGWLHTGDLGSFDAEGYLTITGRKKELIITSGGKNIAPAGIEAMLKEHGLITEVVLVGDNRRFLAALIVVDLEAAAVATTPEQAESEVGRWIEAVNARVARVEAVRAFRILPRPLTLEDGELTPTLKVKRQVVLEHFSDLIEEMYGE